MKVSGETGAAVRRMLLALVLLGLAVFAFERRDSEPVAASPTTTTLPDMVNRKHAGYRDIHWVELHKHHDAAKAGTARSIMVQRFIGVDENVCGPSGDQIRVRFHQAAEVTGIDISVDIGGTLSIVEVMAAVNGLEGYGQEGTADPLAHTSWVREPGGPMFIDKATVLPAPVSVEAGGHVTVGAYLCSTGTSGAVSPEVIVHYRWV